MVVEYLLVPVIAGDRDVQAINAALRALPGVLLVTVSLVDQRVRIEHTSRISVEELLRAINQAGYNQVAVLA
jgi:copper chaperone